MTPTPTYPLPETLTDPLSVIPSNPPAAMPVDAPALWQRFPQAALAGVHTGHAMWSEVMPGGSHWSWRMPRGSAIRFVALEAGANVSVVMYSALEKLERYNMPDSLKAQHTAHYGKGHVLAELDVRPDLWFFPCHFKGDPVMPGCLGLDALWQMTGFFLGWGGSPGRGRALGVGEVKFTDQVLPTVKKVVYGVDLKRVFRSKLVLGIADGWLEADGRRIYEAKDMRVGLFQAEAAAGG